MCDGLYPPDTVSEPVGPAVGFWTPLVEVGTTDEGEAAVTAVISVEDVVTVVAVGLMSLGCEYENSKLLCWLMQYPFIVMVLLGHIGRQARETGSR